MIKLNELTFQQKVELFKDLADDLDITIYAAYGAEEMLISTDITSDATTQKVSIHTSIMTG